MAKGKAAAKTKTTKIIEINSIPEGEISKELVAHIDEDQYRAAIKDKALEIFNPIFLQMKEWRKKIKELDVKEGTDAVAMAQAKEAKNFLVKVRTSMVKSVNEKTDEIKEQMEPFMQKINAWNKLREFTASELRSLQNEAEEKEKVIIRFQEQQRNAVRDARLKEIAELGLNKHMPPMTDIGTVSQEDYAKILDFAKKSKAIEEKEAEKAEENRKTREAEQEKELRTTQRKLQLTREGFAEDKNGFSYQWEDEILFISIEDIQALEDEKYEKIITPILESHNEKKAQKKELEDRAAEQADLVRQTREYLLSLGMEHDPNFNEFRFNEIIIPANDLIGKTKEQLRELMINTSAKIKEIKENIRREEDQKAEQKRQLIASRVLLFKDTKIQSGFLVYNHEKADGIIISKNIIKYSELGDLDEKVLDNLVKEHQELIDENEKNFKADLAAIEKKKMEEIEAQKGDVEKLKDLADKLYNLQKDFTLATLSKDSNKAFASKVIDDINNIIDRIDRHIER